MGAIDIIKSTHVRDLIVEGKREDGRGLMDFRKIKVETNLFENAEGSAMVDLGGTRVLAGIKMDVETPMKDTKDMGNFMVASELLPLAYSEYEAGPPNPESIELARVTDRGIRAGECINLKKLFIEEGKVWSVFADIYVLNYDGNLFDASALAVMSALSTTKVPKYEDGKVVREDRSASLKLDNFTVSTTFAKINGKIAIDPTGNEEGALSSRLTISNDGKVVRAVQKGISGGWKEDEVYDAIGASLEKYKELRSHIPKVR